VIVAEPVMLALCEASVPRSVVAADAIGDEGRIACAGSVPIWKLPFSAE
jgi:hypothetical protein